MAADVSTRELVFDILARISGVPQEDLTMETPIGDAGLGLDSIASLEMLLGIEASTGFRLRSDKLTGDDFRSIANLIHYINTLRDD